MASISTGTKGYHYVRERKVEAFKDTRNAFFYRQTFHMMAMSCSSLLFTFANIVAKVDPLLNLGRVFEILILQEGRLEFLVEEIGSCRIFASKVRKLVSRSNVTRKESRRGIVSKAT